MNTSSSHVCVKLMHVFAEYTWYMDITIANNNHLNLIIVLSLCSSSGMDIHEVLPHLKAFHEGKKETIYIINIYIYIYS